MGPGKLMGGGGGGGTQNSWIAWKKGVVWNSICLCLPHCLGLSVHLPVSLSLVGVCPSIRLGNCGSALLASSVPSRRQQPGGDAQEDPPCAGPSPKDCLAPPPAPPQDPMTGVCGLLRFGSLTKLADWAAEKRGVVRGSVSSLRLALQSVLCPVTPGGSVRRGRPTLDTGGESTPHFSFSPVIPSSRLWSACGCST